jgi:hypothetical protein
MSLLIGSTLAGCSTLKILVGDYPARFDTDGELRERMLAMFVCTVIPSADPAEPNLTRVFQDDFYRFRKYCGFFLSDLAATTRDLHGHENFHLLDLEGRTAVVDRNLHQGGPAGRLATSAVFMAEFSYYAGIYDDERGCPLIDFPGANPGYRPNTLTLAEIESHLAVPMTADGHPL